MVLKRLHIMRLQDALPTPQDTPSKPPIPEGTPKDPMKHLLLLALTAATLLSATTTNAQDPRIQCPGENTYEMRYCAGLSWERSSEQLKRKMPRTMFNQWQEATRAVCAHAFASYKDGTIYPQLIVGCDDKLNRALLKELKPMDEQ